MVSANTKIRVLLTVASLALAVVIAFAITTSAYSQDKAGELAAKLKELSAKLRHQREQHERERRVYASRNELMLEEIEALKRRKSGLKGRRETLEEEGQRLKEEGEELSAEAGSLRKERASIEKVIVEGSDALLAHIEGGMPFGKQRRCERVAELLGEAERPADALKLLWQLYVQEYRRAGEIELSAGTITLGKKVVFEGRILRLGAVGAVFLSDDVRTAAVLAGSPKGHRWLRLSGRSEVSQVRRAFEIAGGRRAPEIVEMPLDISGTGGGE